MIDVVLLLGLVTFRLAHMVVWEDGPGHVFARVRAFVGIEDMQGLGRAVPQKFLPELLSCVWCISVWFGLALGLVFFDGEFLKRVLVGFAASGIACIIETMVIWFQGRS